jgi:glutathione peroxidase
MKEKSVNFYNFSATSIDGTLVELSTYKNKLVLVVNTASECGFTPQYAGLESLYRKYKDAGFVVLGFPCNQFGKQEPGDEASIQTGCLAEYEVTFPMFAKIHVNGNTAHPLYKFLKKELPGILGGRIKWNFTKFLIDKGGNPIMRFAPTDKPSKIEQRISSLLEKDKKL